MARINIEDGLLNDERMRFVCRKIGEETAIGAWYRIARCAQKYWVDGQKPIPKDVWKISELRTIFVEAGLVDKTKDGFYLRGSEKYFAWLLSQKKNATKGGRPKKIKTSVISDTKENPRETRGKPIVNPLTLTLSPTLSPALAKNSTDDEAALPITPDELVHEFNNLFKGKLKPAVGLGSGEHLQNFFRTCLLLKTKDDWISLLRSAADQDWLIKQSKTPLTLSWLVREENAIKVLEGKYSESLASEEEKIKQFFGGSI